MPNHTRRAMYFLGGFFLLCLDQWLKWLIRQSPAASHYLWPPWLGWEYYANRGIAFSIPFPRFLLLLLIPIAIVAFVIVFRREKNRVAELALILLLSGALSNFIDRLRFGITIDYLRVFTGVINLADIMIGAAIILLLFSAREAKNQPESLLKL